MNTRLNRSAWWDLSLVVAGALIGLVASLGSVRTQTQLQRDQFSQDDQTLDKETAASERKELIKYQQAAYDSYEKTITALVASTLALSVAFLAFLQSSRLPNSPLLIPGTQYWLYATWAFLVVGLFSLIACFFINARAFSVEMAILAEAVKDASARTKKNLWTAISLTLYGTSAISLCLGMLALLYFCHSNLIAR